jgi:hypothetical protein
METIWDGGEIERNRGIEKEWVTKKMRNKKMGQLKRQKARMDEKESERQRVTHTQPPIGK